MTSNIVAQYGFAANIAHSTNHNAQTYLATMEPWAYFNRPTNMAFHDLTSTTNSPKNLRSLLGLSLKFIPNPRYNVAWKHYETTTLPRLVNDLKVKAFMATKFEDEAEEEDADDDYNPRMYIRTGWTPPEHLFPFPKELPRRLRNFETAIKSMVQLKKCRSNLLPHQRVALDYLRNQTDLLVVQCDKNLGPALIERSEYIKLAYRDHLDDGDTYEWLTPAQGRNHAARIKRQLLQWLKTHKKVLQKAEKRFLQHHIDDNKDPFATLYLTVKVHKGPPFKTRPVVSCSGSLLSGIGTWVDDKLQIAAKKQRSYFKSSFDLKRLLSSLQIPANASLFIANARSMYTNIPTDRALLFIARYLRKNKFDGIPVEALIEALRLVMKNNIFSFGDTLWRQKTGTAMGTPPAPPWATLYFALLEEDVVPQYDDYLQLYRRFIDDIFGIWLHHQDAATDLEQWTQFQTAINSPVYKLVWDFSPLCQSLDFMDLHLTIKGNQLHTTLYEKPTNLHLYIPPSSCHPPGLLRGIVHGLIFRIYTLCTDRDDKKHRTQLFLLQLLRRGYHRNHLLPLFKEAMVRAKNYEGVTTQTLAERNSLRRSLFFHLPYHPQNPSSQAIQSSWHSHVANPDHGRPLSEVKNYEGTRIGVDRLIIAYNRPPNLGNILSYRKLKDTSGPPVSLYCTIGDM